MTTITLKDNKYIVRFDTVECNYEEYDDLSVAKWLCWLRLGKNIRFIELPIIHKWIVINRLNLFV